MLKNAVNEIINYEYEALLSENVSSAPQEAWEEIMMNKARAINKKYLGFIDKMEGE